MDELLSNIEQVQFPEFAGFMGEVQSSAFEFWVSDKTSPQFTNIIRFMSSEFTPLIVHLSHCLDCINYDVTNELIFLSIEKYLVCVLFHFVPPDSYGRLDLDHAMVAAINSSLILWQSGLVPIFDGLTYRLHNTSSVVSSHVLPLSDDA